MSRDPPVNVLSLTDINTRVHQTLDSLNIEHRFSPTGRSQLRQGWLRLILMLVGFDRLEHGALLLENVWRLRRFLLGVRTPVDRPASPYRSISSRSFYFASVSTFARNPPSSTFCTPSSECVSALRFSVFFVS